ncbi:hypothetical protein [Vaginisenegalia massiliensis]|uniref:hypothetical protein n=1 Tax=Vaginisenegalia massiliensis TaxID=2058294 RepID=UPI000F531EFD|nr:hypothetical protein [Vaginisenegalia massiliensis]
MAVETMFFAVIALIATAIAADQLGYNRGMREQFGQLLNDAYENGLEDGKEDKIVSMKGVAK